MAGATDFLQGHITISQDYFLLLEAQKRMEENGSKNTISFDAVMRNLGIEEDELSDTEDVNIE